LSSWRSKAEPRTKLVRDVFDQLYTVEIINHTWLWSSFVWEVL
jgi:hypothetical protein